MIFFQDSFGTQSFNLATQSFIFFTRSFRIGYPNLYDFFRFFGTLSFRFGYFFCTRSFIFGYPNLNDVFFSRSFIFSIWSWTTFYIWSMILNQITVGKWKGGREEKWWKEKKSQTTSRRNKIKEKDKPEIFLKNGQLNGLFHFVTWAVNILSVYYVYENFLF